MMDPIVEETRRAGEKLFARHGNNMHSVVEYLRERERQNGRKVVSLPAKAPLIRVHTQRKKAG